MTMDRKNPYLSAIPAAQIDLYSRLVVGWAMHQPNNAELLLGALDMVIVQRAVHPVSAGLILPISAEVKIPS